MIVVAILVFVCLLFTQTSKDSQKSLVVDIIATIHQMEQEIKPDHEDTDLGKFFSQEKLIQKRILIECENLIHEKYYEKK